MNYNKLLQKAIEKVSPSEKEMKQMNLLVEKTIKIAKEVCKPYNAMPIIAGSVTRNTWLKDKKEFDVFVAFPEDLSRKELEKQGLEIGEKIAKKLKGKVTIQYAEHPYVNIKVKDYEIDVVPCYNLKTLQKIKSSVDRTPFHVKFLEENLKAEMAKEVRLLKAFLKAINAYGADIKTQGLSGYATELLIIHYGSFLNFLKNFAEAEAGLIIDIKNYYTKQDYPKLVRKFKNEPLILIDPVDKNRNVTSALSIENFYRIKRFAKKFLEKPSLKYFEKIEPKPYSKDKLEKVMKKRGTKFLLIVFNKPDVLDDILYGQIRKFVKRIVNILEERKYEFSVFDKDFFVDEKNKKIYVLIEMKVYKLPNIQKKIGPIVFDVRNSKKFLNQHEKALVKPYVEENRWAAIVKRKFKTAKQKIVDSLSVPERILLAKGIPSYIAQQISKKFSVREENFIVKLAERNAEFNKFLVRYFEKKW